MTGEGGTGPYMALPSCMLWILKNELSKNDVQEKNILFNVGMETGRRVGLANKVEMAMDQVPDFIHNHYMENGLGRPFVKRKRKSFVVSMEEPSEVEPGRGKDCSFSAGYLCGLISIFLKRKYLCSDIRYDKVNNTCTLMLKPE